MPCTVPVQFGLLIGAFRSRALCVAVVTGLCASAVLSALPSTTIVLVMPLTVPIQVELASGAFRTKAL